jgi:hypothetical protein
LDSRLHRNQDQAAPGASTLVAPDTFQQQSEQQAAMEAALIAAPDTLSPVPAPSDSKFMSGGRSTGDLQVLNDVNAESTQNISDPSEIPTTLTNENRPTLAAGQNYISTQSISQLHIPGEFPKGVSS